MASVASAVSTSASSAAGESSAAAVGAPAVGGLEVMGRGSPSGERRRSRGRGAGTGMLRGTGGGGLESCPTSGGEAGDSGGATPRSVTGGGGGSSSAFEPCEKERWLQDGGAPPRWRRSSTTVSSSVSSSWMPACSGSSPLRPGNLSVTSAAPVAPLRSSGAGGVLGDEPTGTCSESPGPDDCSDSSVPRGRASRMVARAATKSGCSSGRNTTVSASRSLSSSSTLGRSEITDVGIASPSSSMGTLTSRSPETKAVPGACASRPRRASGARPRRLSTGCVPLASACSGVCLASARLAATDSPPARSPVVGRRGITFARPGVAACAAFIARTLGGGGGGVDGFTRAGGAGAGLFDCARGGSGGGPDEGFDDAGGAGGAFRPGGGGRCEDPPDDSAAGERFVRVAIAAISPVVA